MKSGAEIRYQKEPFTLMPEKILSDQIPKLVSNIMDLNKTVLNKQVAALRNELNYSCRQFELHALSFASFIIHVLRFLTKFHKNML